MKYYLAVASFLLLTVATFAHAGEYHHKATGLQFEVPAGWTCTEKDNRISLDNTDKTVSLVGDVIPAENVTKIFGDIKGFLGLIDGLSNVEVAEGPEKEEVNGLQQSWYSGTASFKDKDGQEQEIEWDLTVVTGGKDVLFFFGTGKIDEQLEAYESIFESIELADESE